MIKYVAYLKLYTVEVTLIKPNSQLAFFVKTKIKLLILLNLHDILIFKYIHSIITIEKFQNKAIKFTLRPALVEAYLR